MEPVVALIVIALSVYFIVIPFLPNKSKTIAIQQEVLKVDEKRTTPLINALTAKKNAQAWVFTLAVAIVLWLILQLAPTYEEKHQPPTPKSIERLDGF